MLYAPLECSRVNLLLSADSSNKRVQSLLNFCGLLCGLVVVSQGSQAVDLCYCAPTVCTPPCSVGLLTHVYMYHMHTQWKTHKVHKCMDTRTHTYTCTCSCTLCVHAHARTHMHIKPCTLSMARTSCKYIISLSLSLSFSPSPSPSPSPQQAQAEQEEEFISNTLLKKIHSLKKEKEALAMNYEQEEEFLTNDLSRKLAQVHAGVPQLAICYCMLYFGY